MEEMRSFTKAKAQVATALSQLADFFTQRGQAALLWRACALADKLATEQFNLVVLGQFKRGKSTLINALLGADLLPTAVVPLTSIVTIIQHGPQPYAVVRFLDGRTLEVDIADLALYSTERDNPGNVKGVAQVEVACPSAFLRAGVRLVDTPGVGSVYASNTGTTYEYLPQADAAIVVLAADQPISQAELEFVHAAGQYAAKFFFVLNKIDMLSAPELKESLEFSARVVAASVGSEVVLHPLSARAAFQARLRRDHAQLEASRLPAFEQALTEFLMRAKGTTLLSTTRARGRQLLTEALDAIDLELAALRLPAEVLAQRLEAFRAKADEIMQEQRDTAYVLRGEISALTASVEVDLRPFLEEHVPQLTRRMDTAFEAHRHRRRGEIIKALNAEMARAVAEIFAPWRQDEEASMSVNFDRITARFTARANRIIDELQRLATDLFDVRLTPLIEVEPFTMESSHYYYTDMLFSLQLATLPLLLPAPLAKRHIRRQFLGACREELDRNAGRLRADFQERLTRSARAFSTAFDAKVQATLNSLTEILQQAAEAKRRSDTELAARQGNLEADRTALVAIRAGLAEDAAPAHTLSRHARDDAGHADTME
jgi:GTP-binding protein EngB required for normal cell division